MKPCPHFFKTHVQNTPFWRHIDAILTPSWLVPPALLTFKRHLPVLKAYVLLTFCTYKVLYTKNAGGKNCMGTSQDGVLMATMRCARQHARGHWLQRCRQRVGLLVDLFCDLGLCMLCIWKYAAQRMHISNVYWSKKLIYCSNDSIKFGYPNVNNVELRTTVCWTKSTYNL